MPLVEAIVGTHAHTLYDAIFDVELSEELEHELYEEFEEMNEQEDTPALRSLTSRENIRSGNRERSGTRTRTPSRPRPLSVSIPNSPSPKPGMSPNRKAKESYMSIRSAGSGTLKAPSPLVRLFAGPRLSASMSENTVAPPPMIDDDTLAGIGRLEKLLDGIKNLPAQKIRDEMKDLQVFLFCEICTKMFRN